MNRPHVHEVACLPVGESERTAIFSLPDKLGRIGESTVNVVYLALQSFGGLFMFPPLPVYRLVLPFYLGVQAFVLLGKVVYLLLLLLDFGCVDHQADTACHGYRHDSADIERLFALGLAGGCAEVTQRADNRILHPQDHGRGLELVRDEQEGIPPRGCSLGRYGYKHRGLAGIHNLFPPSGSAAGQFECKLRIYDDLTPYLRNGFVDFSAFLDRLALGGLHPNNSAIPRIL